MNGGLFEVDKRGDERMIRSTTSQGGQDDGVPLGDVRVGEQFLRGLGKVLRDRSLYPQDHPQIVAGESEVYEAAGDLFNEQSSHTFVIVDSYIYMNDRLMGGAGKNLSEISRTLGSCGLEVLTVTRGIDQEELRGLTEWLAANQGRSEPSKYPASPHIQIGRLSIGGEGYRRMIDKKGLENLEFAVSRQSPDRTSFPEEAKILEEVYVDWNTAQEMLVRHVEKVMQTLERSLFSNLHSFIPLGNLKSYDEYTYVHAINLAMLTMAQAQLLGFSKEAIHAFGMGALLHDVGKTQVSVNVLHKQGQLSPEEFQEMKRHTTEGALLLLQYPEIPRIAAIVAYEHHLKYDCTGYPDIQWERPQHIASRITAISDQFDAMRSNRPYRDAMEPAQIFDIMEENRGKDLDPDLLDHFFAMMKSRRIA